MNQNIIFGLDIAELIILWLLFEILTTFFKKTVWDIFLEETATNIITWVRKYVSKRNFFISCANVIYHKPGRSNNEVVKYSRLLTILLYSDKNCYKRITPTGKIKIVFKNHQIELVNEENGNFPIYKKPYTIIRNSSRTSFPIGNSIIRFSYDLEEIFENKTLNIDDIEDIVDVLVECYTGKCEEFLFGKSTKWKSSIKDGHDRIDGIKNSIKETHKIEENRKSSKG